MRTRTRFLLFTLTLSASAVRADDPAKSWQEMLRDRAQWWSLQPLRKPDLPRASHTVWSDHPVDRFILAKLEQKGLTPAEPANPRTLIRRLSLVLTGLPPTPNELDAFLKEWPDRDQFATRPGAPGQSAIEQLVDRLLASPHFGERWARHWLDVVRFSETHGNEWNYEVHHAWRYRDFVIRAFNEDVHYDQFVREQIAGDLLSEPRWNRREQFNESVIGTAFYRFGEVNHDDCIGLRQIGYDLADNQIDTLGKAFQATTIACARCHEHKLDAVSMRDYYALLGVLRSSRQVSHTIDAPQVNAEPMKRLRGLKTQFRKELGEIWLHDAREVGRYLLAAQARRDNRAEAAELAVGLDAKRIDAWVAALGTEKMPMDEPLWLWRSLASSVNGQKESDSPTESATSRQAGFAEAWRRLAEQFAKEHRGRGEFNKQFVTFADFRTGEFAGWQAGGHGLRDGASRSGEFVIAHEGDSLVRAILPAGCFTHSLSDKLNGTLRSSVLPRGTKRLSFQVMGQRSSAVRLVSNNCQLNYKNYRALTTGDLQWVTFEPPEETDSLRVYAELMTMLDNPKFPDQLATLGGDKENYRLPWEKAAANPRSYFGVTRVVVHDGPEPPRAELGHVRRLFGEARSPLPLGEGQGEGLRKGILVPSPHPSALRAGEAGNVAAAWVGRRGLVPPYSLPEGSTAAEPSNLADIAARYGVVVRAAVLAWGEDRPTDDDVRWLDSMLQRGLLSNSIHLTPSLEGLTAQYRETERQLAQPRVVPGLADFGPGFDQPLLARGDYSKPGEPVPRRYLEVLYKSDNRFASPGSGRLELAEQIASPNNPLTARVMVNRIWHHLFGSGLVRTVDDFGRVGELPSHPELLDHLAASFVEDGWSIKRLIRSLVRTRTFQMSNRPSPAATEIDPQNRLLQHYPARRMEAEAIRDSVLACSGRLDRTLYAMSVHPYREQENADRRLFPGPLDGAGRRSIYIKNTLMESPRFLSAFNFPGGKVTQGRRDMTNVPTQALALLNDPFVEQQAGVWAEHLVVRLDASVTARIEHMFRVALGRPPADPERSRFEQSVVQIAGLHSVPENDILKNHAVWKDVAHAMFNLKEFIYIP